MSGKVVHVLGGLPYDVYVGRSNDRYGLRGHAFQNPYRIGPHGTRDEVLAKFEDLLRRFLLRSPVNVVALERLRGLTLACWCAPKYRALTAEDETVCHGQIILRLAEEPHQPRSEAGAP